MVSGGGARTHRPKGRDEGKPRRNIWVLSLCPRSPCPSAFLPLPHTLRAEECTVGARRPVVTIIVCSVRRMSLEPTAPRPGLHGGRRKAHNRSAIPGPAIRPALHGEVSLVPGDFSRRPDASGARISTPRI